MKQKTCIKVIFGTGKNRRNFSCCAMVDVDKIKSHKEMSKMVAKMLSNYERE